MKILIAEHDKAFCLHLPLALICNRVGAALLAGGLRHTQRLSDGSGKADEQKELITTAQVHGLLKTLRQSKQTLRRSELPLLDIQKADGSRLMITL
ncbi:MAG: hypothetical protein J1E43_03915 [Christensenellaceae bacterium]|nr:hypothetical protein [Christensenellaceae bacterium]